MQRCFLFFFTSHSLCLFGSLLSGKMKADVVSGTSSHPVSSSLCHTLRCSVSLDFWLRLFFSRLLFILEIRMSFSLVLIPLPHLVSLSGDCSLKQRREGRDVKIKLKESEQRGCGIRARFKTLTSALHPSTASLCRIRRARYSCWNNSTSLLTLPFELISVILSWRLVLRAALRSCGTPKRCHISSLIALI